MGALPVDRAARNVTGQQVGRELNSAKATIYALGQRLADQRLANAGNVFQQYMFASQEGDRAQAHHFGLAEHHAAHVRFQVGDKPLQFCRRLFHGYALMRGFRELPQTAQQEIL